jgi:hypothetical protein
MSFSEKCTIIKYSLHSISENMLLHYSYSSMVHSPCAVSLFLCCINGLCHSWGGGGGGGVLQYGFRFTPSCTESGGGTLGTMLTIEVCKHLAAQCVA